MRFHKIRIIQKGPSGEVIGLSIPSEMKHWINIVVTIRESGNALILESGTIPLPLTNKELVKNSIETKFLKI